MVPQQLYHTPLPLCRACQIRRCRTRTVGNLQTRHATGDLDKSISMAKEKLSRDDRLGALRECEKAVAEDISTDERILMLYNMTAIHGSMGDVELAQVRHFEVYNVCFFITGISTDSSTCPYNVRPFDTGSNASSKSIVYQRQVLFKRWDIFAT